MSSPDARPIPYADDVSSPFWQAAREHRLDVQRCQSCRYYNHPPRRVCDACLAQDLRFEPVSGRGQIYSFTVMHQRDVTGFENDAPFINLVIELEEQPKLLMVSTLPGNERDRIKIGAPVEVFFENRGEGADTIVIPQFRLTVGTAKQ
jgi:uncharacterized OB-fold protein